MKTIFVSSQNIDFPSTAELIAKLREASFQVSHSPRNPVAGKDERWSDWYTHGLPEEVAKVKAFIIAIDADWDSSCWMLIEAEEARQRLAQGNLKTIYCYNPAAVIVRNPTSWRNYMKTLLPNNIGKVVAILSKETE